MIDQDGYVSIVGRAKDMVITGGLNVYPKELELLLDKMDGVLESAVIGVAHSDFGEAVLALVVTSDAVEFKPDHAMASLKNTLAGFKVPKKICVIKALPRNTMGKVQKSVLREQYANVFD